MKLFKNKPQSPTSVDVDLSWFAEVSKEALRDYHLENNDRYHELAQVLRAERVTSVSYDTTTNTLVFEAGDVVVCATGAYPGDAQAVAAQFGLEATRVTLRVLGDVPVLFFESQSWAFALRPDVLERVAA